MPINARLSMPTQYTFRGLWKNKYWKNIPGPFYSTTDNLLSLLASGDDPKHLLFDEDCEFVWRQPDNQVELDACAQAMDVDEVGSFAQAMNVDEVGSYQIDGDLHWTAELVRAWWRRRNELLQWAHANLVAGEGYAAGHSKQYPDMAAARPIAEYIRFMEHEAERYLRRYVFFLENVREPAENEELPGL